MSLRFASLAATLEALEPVTGRTQMISMLAELLSQAGPDDIVQLVYLSQGRLLPDFIQEEFGMNERLIYRSVALAYQVPVDEVLARAKQLGDAGLVAQEYAQRWLEQSSPSNTSRAGLSLQEVYAHLMQITKTVGQGSTEGKVSLLARLFENLSPLEAKHVARIVVGRLRVGIGDPTLWTRCRWRRRATSR